MSGKGNLLAVETSFDDTGLALLSDEGGVVWSALSSSVALHADYGGVVPEIAAREHLTNLPVLLAELRSAQPAALQDVGAVGVTCGPGLPGCLLAGVAFARGFAAAVDARLYGLNHLEGHLYSPFFGTSAGHLSFPFLGLVVSGGNTVLYLVQSLGESVVLGETLDDAAGELFDKVAQRLGLGYPGGAVLERLAREHGDSPVSPELKLPVPMRESGDLNFSFSGLKTAAVRMIAANEPVGADFRREFSASLLRSVWDSIWEKVLAASAATGVRLVSVSGGVSVNGLFREHLTERCESAGLKVLFPHPRLAMDNAEMMAYLLWLKRGNGVSPSAFDIQPGLV